MAQAQHSDLTRSERDRLSPEQWKANHARSDAQKLVNPPPSLEGFLPDKPPPPKLVASPTGKVAAHVAHAPLTHSLGDKLRDMLPGETTHVNPLVVVTAGKGETVAASNDTPEPPKVEPKRLAIGEQYIAGNSIRTRRKPDVVHLRPDERREALVWAYAYGSHETSMRFNISQGAIGPWMRMCDAIADGEALPKSVSRFTRLYITGVNTPGSTRATAQAIRDEGAKLRDTPETVLEAPAPAPEPVKEPDPAPPVVESPLAAARRLNDEIEMMTLQQKLAEREATLAGYKIELEKLRSENAMLTKHNDTLRAVSEALAGKRR